MNLSRAKVPALLAALAGLALIAEGAFSQAPPTSPSPPRISPGQAATDLNAVVNDLSQARSLAVRIGDPGLRSQIDLFLSRAELNARNLRDRLTAAATAKPATPPLVAIAPGPFAEFLAAMKKNSFDDGKADFVVSFGKAHRFTSDQVATLLKAFDFDKGRARAAIALHPRVVDPGNFFKVLDTFTFDSGRQEVSKAIGIR